MEVHVLCVKAHSSFSPSNISGFCSLSIIARKMSHLCEEMWQKHPGIKDIMQNFTVFCDVKGLSLVYGNAGLSQNFLH